jgi:hypothetical protein
LIAAMAGKWVCLPATTSFQLNNRMPNDFDPKDLTKTVDQHHADLVAMKRDIDELKDKKLDEKICKAIQDSTHIQTQIGQIVWKTTREKIIWILLTLLAVLLWDVMKDVLTNALSKVTTGQ